MTRDAVRLRFRAGELSELLRLAGPVILARLGIMAMGLTDAVVVGRYSAEQLGFHALAWAPTGAVLLAGIGLLTGVQVMTARYVGAGRRNWTGGVFRRGLVYGWWIGLVSGALLALLGPPFLHHLGLKGDLADGAVAPLRVFSLSLPLYLMSIAASFYLEALGRPKVVTAVMWAANAVNLGLNLLLVPGSFGLPALGAVGAACATLGSRGFLMVVLVLIVLRMKEAHALGVWSKPQDGRDGARTQRQVGYAAGVSYFVEAGAFSAMSLITGALGAVQVAAWAVVLNVASIIFMPPLGLATATAVLVGRAYGAKDERGVAGAGVLGFLVSAAISVVVVAVVWPGAGLIARGYSSDPALVAMAAAALVLSCLFYTADGLQVVAAQALRARGDVWMPTAIHIVNYGVLMGPLAWFLALKVGLGLNGVVWAVTASSLASGCALVGRFLLLSRRRQREVTAEA